MFQLLALKPEWWVLIIGIIILGIILKFASLFLDGIRLLFLGILIFLMVAAVATVVGMLNRRGIPLTEYPRLFVHEFKATVQRFWWQLKQWVFDLFVVIQLWGWV